MKKIFLLSTLLLSFIANSFAATITGEEAERMIQGAEIIITKDSGIPQFIQFREGEEIPFQMLDKWMHHTFKAGNTFGFKLLNTLTDELGVTHYRYQQTWNGLPVQGTMWLAHVKNGNIISLNGEFYASLSCPVNASISESVALGHAMNFMNATEYRWQDAETENVLKYETNDPMATFYPKGELVFTAADGNYGPNTMRLCYKFDIYATTPLTRKYVFVDAITGQIIYSLDRIHETNATGSAVTGYLGTKTITTDSFSGGYRLRETGRGSGIETYNLKTTKTYSNTDFVDTDNNWNNVNTAKDQYATDAHYGAEMTYDYYKTTLNRNSIDNAGMKLLSYVHYDVNYLNAFWDGSRMTYGDAYSPYTPLTAIDITGHEISHGVTEHTCNLDYQYEPGALNEGFSDCLGTAIEFYGASSKADWLIGEDIGTAFRSMSNPKTYGQPDTYKRTNWATGFADNGGVHTNSGVLNYWFYLVSLGGADVNDNGNSYNITGITMDKAVKILYRAWSVYMTSTSQYSDARQYTIQAAIDLYGACTPEVITVTNAWYAVGVGAVFNATVKSDFQSNPVAYCSIPATVQFQNLSTNAGTFKWYFGDGGTSTLANPAHVYTSFGTYNIKLVASGGNCGSDSVTKTGYIVVSSSVACNIKLPAGGKGTTQTSCVGILYDDGGPTGNYADNKDSWMTIAPPGATGLKLTFTKFRMEDLFDYLYIYDGADTNSTLIGKFTGFSLPNGGVIYPSGNKVTIRTKIDQASSDTGFAMSWQCFNAPPVVNFGADATQTCDGVVNFKDLSVYSPTSWKWSFGDGGSSTLKNPTHTYANNGVYTVKLVASNLAGKDSSTYVNFVSVNKPAGPAINDTFLCTSASVKLTAKGTGTLKWYNAATAGTLLATGNTYTTPVLSSTQTYYVEDVVVDPQKTGGKPSNSGGGGNFPNTYDRYLIFDVYQPVKLVSMVVYAQGTANRTIEWRNSSGVVLKDTTINIANGTQTVTVNWGLVPGTNYRMAIKGTSNLYRNNGSATFPYTTTGYLSITGSNVDQAGYYYYFYNWKLQPYACISERKPVTVYVGTATPPIVSPSGPVTVCQGQSATLTAPSGAASYKWSNGATTRSINVTSPGNFYVIVTAAGGCKDTSKDVTVVISPIPTASFTKANSGSTFNFTNTSTGATSYTWDFGDLSPVDHSTDPSHLYVVSKNYTVTLVACNGDCCDTTSSTLSVLTGITALSGNSDIKVYPNPTTGKLFIQVSDNQSGEAVTGFLTNVLGQQLSIKLMPANKDAWELDMTNYAAGTYFLHLKTRNTEEVVKVIKVKD